MKYGYLAVKDDWEEARLIAYVIAQVNSKKKKKINEFLEFDWEKPEKGDTSISKADIRRLKKKAQAYLDSKKPTNE